MNNNLVKRISSLALFLALAILLNYIENLIPLPVIVPGLKLGLANTMNLIILYFYGKKEYFSIGFLRVLLISLMFSGIFSNAFFLSMSGFLLSSIAVMLLSNIKGLSLYSLSVTSAIYHGIGQILCAIVLYWTGDGSSIYLLTYIPILSISGVITGLGIAFISKITIERLEKTTLFS